MCDLNTSPASLCIAKQNSAAIGDFHFCAQSSWITEELGGTSLPSSSGDLAMATQTADPPAVKLLTMRETAKAMSLSERTVWSLIRCGTLPHLRFGRAVRVAVRDLDEFLAA